MAEAAADAGVHVRQGITINGVCLDDAGRATGVYGQDRTGASIEIEARLGRAIDIEAAELAARPALDEHQLVCT